MINHATLKYALPALEPERAQGVYFPDIVIDALGESAGQCGALHVEESTETARRFSLDEAKTLVVAAAGRYDPALGQRVAGILGDASRMNIREVAPGTVEMQRVRPAGSFTDETGLPAAQAVIDYDFDGSMNAVIYLAHEAGHAVADDLQNEGGYDYRSNPMHMQETQAYFLQHIAYKDLKAHPDAEIAGAARRCFNREMALYDEDLRISFASMDAFSKIEQGREIDPAAIFRSRLGAGWQHTVETSAPAASVFTAMRTWQTSTGDTAMREEAKAVIQNAAARLHDRPVSILLCMGMVERAQNLGAESRRSVYEHLMGRNGPMPAGDVLARIGVERAADMKALADKTMDMARGNLAAPGEGARPERLVEAGQGVSP